MLGNVVDVTDTNFDYEVIAYSQQETPVITHFWAPWCIPCRTVDKTLQALAEEHRGRFRLARLNVDRNPKVTRRFQVQSLPTLRAFHLGQSVAALTGNLTPDEVRAFVRRALPDSSRLLLEKGDSLLKLDLPIEAEGAFRQYLEAHPENADALLGMGKSLLLQGRGREALEVLRSMPSASPAYAQAQVLLPLAEALTQARYADPLDSNSPLEAAYWRAVHLIQNGNFAAALDGLLDILREDKNFGAGKPHELVLALFALLGEENDLTVQYRKELSSVLFA